MMTLAELHPLISKAWTLFLDRDGVINVEKKQDYIRNPQEFHFYEGIPEAIATLNQRFGRTIIVTNQRGIGKGLMSDQDLKEIHEHMCSGIHLKGGTIDHIYYAPSIENDSILRKPNSGMALAAQKDFPDIHFQQSVMVGNNLSDMEFGKRLGMTTVYVETTHPLPDSHELIDIKLHSLTELAMALCD
jgi:HAD superfamily hydrolase (TIGR01662 family)